MSRIGAVEARVACVEQWLPSERAALRVQQRRIAREHGPNGIDVTGGCRGVDVRALDLGMLRQQLSRFFGVPRIPNGVVETGKANEKIRQRIGPHGGGWIP